MRVQREQSRLSGLTSDKRDRLAEIGERVWEMHKAQQITDARLLALCRQLETLNSQIADQERAVERIKDEQPPEPPKCPACGRELATSDQFCPGCGAAAPIAPAAAPAAAATTPPVAAMPAVPPVPAASAPAANHCPRCGKALRPGATFCGGCGARLA